MLSTYRPLESQKQAAYAELAAFIEHQAAMLRGVGWSYHATADAPESFKALKEQTRNRCIPVANYGCDKSIYSHSVNVMFRFYHDAVHLEHNLGFNFDDEMAVADIHMADAKAYGLSDLAMQALVADTRGQVGYYFKHKEFVDNQAAFVSSCLDLGINNAMRVKH